MMSHNIALRLRLSMGPKMTMKSHHHMSETEMNTDNVYQTINRRAEMVSRSKLYEFVYISVALLLITTVRIGRIVYFRNRLVAKSTK